MTVANFLKVFAEEVALNGGKLPDRYAALISQPRSEAPQVQISDKTLGKRERERIINETVKEAVYGSIC